MLALPRDRHLWRLVHPSMIDEGEPTSNAFLPTKKDTDRLSVDDSSLTEASTSFLRHTGSGHGAAGVWAVTAGDADLDAYPDVRPDNPAHAFVDFAGLPSNAARKSAAQLLKSAARRRGRMHP